VRFAGSDGAVMGPEFGNSWVLASGSAPGRGAVLDLVGWG
jgi:hypothetical protein